MQLEEGHLVHLCILSRDFLLVSQAPHLAAWPHTTMTLLMGFYILLPAQW